MYVYVYAPHCIRAINFGIDSISSTKTRATKAPHLVAGNVIPDAVCPEHNDFVPWRHLLNRTQCNCKQKSQGLALVHFVWTPRAVVVADTDTDTDTDTDHFSTLTLCVTSASGTTPAHASAVSPIDRESASPPSCCLFFHTRAGPWYPIPGMYDGSTHPPARWMRRISWRSEGLWSKESGTAASCPSRRRCPRTARESPTLAANSEDPHFKTQISVVPDSRTLNPVRLRARALALMVDLRAAGRPWSVASCFGRRTGRSRFTNPEAFAPFTPWPSMTPTKKSVS